MSTSASARPKWIVALAGTSLTARLVLTFGAIVLLTVVAAAAPTYALISDELERQAWSRVESGGRLAQILLDNERARLDHLAATLAERPTLVDLVGQNDRSGLTAYLSRFRQGIDADLVQVLDESGEVVAWSTTDPTLGRVGAATEGFAWTSSPGSQLLLQVSRPLAVGADGFRVRVATAIDDDFVSRLAVTTSLEQAFYFEGRRLASSLDVDGAPVDLAPPRVASADDGLERVVLSASGQHLYAVRAAVGGDVGPTGIVLEVALPVDDLLAAEAQWRLALGLGTLLVTAGSTGLGLWISRRLTQPLRQLTSAAVNFGQGDLTTPVPLPVDPPEIRALARTLEESRIHIRESLERLARQKDWSDTLLRSIVEGIVTVDGQGRVTSFSAAAERITGWRSDEVLGRRVDEVVRTADGDPFSEEVPNPGVAGRCECCIAPDGR